MFRLIALTLLVCGALPACREEGPTAAVRPAARAAFTSAPFAADPITAGLFVAAGGDLQVGWLDSHTTNTWHAPESLSRAAFAPPGGAVAVARQTNNILTALYFDDQGALELSWIDVTSGTGWAAPHALTGPGVAPAGGNVALSQQGTTAFTGLFFDNQGTLQRVFLITDGLHQWQGPEPLSASGLGVPGGTIALGPQTDQLLAALYLDRSGALSVHWLNTAPGNSWAGPFRLTPSGVAPAGGGVAVARQDALIFTCLYFDNRGQLTLYWINNDGSHSWTTTPTVLTGNVAPAGAQLALLKQSDTVLTALFIDNAGRLAFEWLNTTGGYGWAGPLEVAGQPALLAQPGSPVAAVSQTIDITTALFVDSSGAVEMTKLDSSSSGSWTAPVSITSPRTVPVGGHLALGKHPEKSCGGHGQVCCSQTGCDDAHDVCDGPGGRDVRTDPRNSCQCGGVAEPCCAGSSCGAGLACLPSTTGTLAPVCQCGGKDQPCCPAQDVSGASELACNGWLQCSGGSCQCGAPGQLCCGNQTCNDGKACQKDAHGTGHCPACGGQGQACCATGNACSTGLQCSAGSCAPKLLTCSGAQASGNAQLFGVGLKDANGCALSTVVWVFANTQAEAVACLTRANPGSIADTSGMNPQPYPVAVTDTFLDLCTDTTQTAYSSADALRCATASCSDPSKCKLAPGLCSGSGGHAPVASCGPVTCGPIPDGQGGILECGSCPAGETCGGGGASGTCGCTPLTCETAGAACGAISDGCGGTLSCGSCPAGQACGGGGTPGVCACKRRHTCGGHSCGLFDDGCGGQYCCGGPDCC